MASAPDELNTDNLKYRKLYQWARALIRSGVFKDGDRFLSEHSLEKKFGYSRQTVRRALEDLEAEGLISRERGSGTYVTYKNRTDQGKPHIGLIVSYFYDYLFPEVYAGIESVLKEHGFEIDVAVTRNDVNIETVYLESFLKSGVIGLIVEGTRSAFPNPNIRVYREIRKRNIPTIFIHNSYQNIPFNSVDMADEEGCRMLIDALAKQGHRKIGGIFKYDDIQGLHRFRGFVEGLADNGIRYDDDWIRWYSTRSLNDQFSREGMLDFYRRTKECTAVVMYNDGVAYPYMDFLEERGVMVPDDLSLVSFDDTMLHAESSVRILSMVHPKFELGQTAARNLVRMLGDPDWQQHDYSYRFQAVLNNGNSVGPVRTDREKPRDGKAGEILKEVAG